MASQNQLKSPMQKIPLLKPISPADADQLRKLYEYSLKLNPQGFVACPTFHGDIYDRAVKYQQNNGAMFGLFDENNKLLGFGGLKQKDGGRAELCNLHLHPDYQGQGNGKLLAYMIIDEARDLKYDVLELHVTVTQEKAIGLYKRLGFKETGRKVYDVDGQRFDTLFMELRL